VLSVLVPDRIGYGRSSKPDIPYNLYIFGLDAKHLLDHLAVDGVAILGHSMGGMAAGFSGVSTLCSMDRH